MIPEDKYELVKVHYVYISKPGRQFIMFDNFCTLDNIDVVDVLEGDIIGFSYPVNNSAKITSTTGETDLENVSVSVYEGKLAELGEILEISNAEVRNWRYALQGHCQTVSKFSVPFNYSAIGVYNEKIQIGSYEEEMMMLATAIVATENISEVNWTTPCAVLTNSTATFTVLPHLGYNISYNISYGDNISDSSMRARATENLDFNHIFSQPGSYSVTLCAKNELSLFCLQCKVIVQNEILNLFFYKTMEVTALTNVTETCFYLNAGSGVTITVDFHDGTEYKNGTFDIDYVFAACYYHTYAAIGEYPITINASNLVSSLANNYTAIVEVPVSGCVLTVEHANRDIEVNETVSVVIVCEEGTNALYVCDFDDGSIETTSAPPFRKSYPVWRYYSINCTIYNNVSRLNVSQTVQVHKPVDPLTGFAVTTAPTNLTDPVAFMLNISTGTDFKCSWTWQDGFITETSSEDLGRFVEHKYSSVGVYYVIVNCTNRLYNTTVGIETIVQKPITGLILKDPGSRLHDQSFLAQWEATKGTNITYNVTWKHVVSGSLHVITITTLSADTLSGSSVIYPVIFSVIGVYELSLTAVNLVTSLQRRKITVYVDKIIRAPVLTNCHLHYIVNGTTCFTLVMVQGSNVTIDWTFSDNRPTAVYHQGDFPSNGSEIQHAFYDQGNYEVTAFIHNSVSNISLRTHIILQYATNFLILATDSPKPIPDGSVIFSFSLLPGSKTPSTCTFSCVWGDGDELHLQKLATVPFNLQHKYENHGAYVMNCTFGNLISNTTLWATVELQEPIQHLVPVSRHTAGDAGAGAEGRGKDKTYFPLEYPVLFYTTIRNGTNVSYFWDFGDGNNILIMNETIYHKYDAVGTYHVTVTAENAVSKFTKALEVTLQKIVTVVTFSNDGPAKLGTLMTFTTKLGQEATDACYLFDLGNGTKFVYKDVLNINCEPECSLLENEKSFSGTSIIFQYNYTMVHNYKVKLSACNKVSKVEVDDDATVAPLPCRYPEVNITKKAASISLVDAPKYTKSESFEIKSQNKIDCEASHLTSKHWDIYKVDMNSGNETKIIPPTHLYLEDSTLVVGPRTFDYGCFKVRLTLTMLNVDGISNDDNAYFCIVPSPLIAEIVGGTAMAVGFGKTHTVDASSSYDPDVGQGNQDGMEFEWFCAKKDEHFDITSNKSILPSVSVLPPFEKTANQSNATFTLSCNQTSGCFRWVSGPTRLNISSSKVTLSTGYFIVNCDYELFVKVKKDSRSAWAQMALFIKEGDPPIVRIM